MRRTQNAESAGKALLDLKAVSAWYFDGRNMLQLAKGAVGVG